MEPMSSCDNSDGDPNKASTSGASNKRKAEWFEIDEERNTYVYVSGLPKTFTENEFIDLMKKYGIIATKPIHGNPYNIKLYRDQDGNFKGDAICCYAQRESVQLALQFLDNYYYDTNHQLHCEKAKFQLKGSYDPSKKPRPLDKKARMRHKQKVQKMLSWEPKKEFKQKKVILKNMFTPQEISDEPELLIDLKADVEELCSATQCEPKRIDIFDNHADGVISVLFPDSSQADKFVAAAHNKPYAGRFVTAELWDGITKYKIKETDEETQRRIEKFHKDIEEAGDEELGESHHKASTDDRATFSESNDKNTDTHD